MVNDVNAAEGISVQAEVPAVKVSVAGIRKKVTSNFNKAALSVIVQQAVIVVVAVALSAAALIFYMIQGKGGGALSTDMGMMLTITGLSGIVADIVAAVFIAKTVKLKELKKAFRAPEGGIVNLILPAFAIAGMSQIISSLLTMIPFLKNSADSFNSVNINFDNPVYAAIGILYIALLGPVLEEILCRGMILRVGSSISNKFGVILSALLFSFMHMNFLQGTNTFIMGIILGYVTIKSGSIIPAVIAHIFNNCMAIAVYAVEPVFGEAAAEAFGKYLPFVLGALGVISLIILFVRNKKLDEAKDRSLESNIRVSDEMIADTGISREVIAKHALSRSWAFYVLLGMFLISGTVMMLLPALSSFLQNS